MVRSMVDDLDVEVGPGGTTATFRHRLTREATLLAPTPGASRESARVGRGETTSVAADGPVLRVAGAMDAQGAERLRTALHRATRGGTAEVVVDLSDVTYLGSCGVRVLAEALRDRGVSLVAPPGSVAQHVLDVVRVQHRRAV
jgi:anti-anti-sigma factor